MPCYLDYKYLIYKWTCYFNTKYTKYYITSSIEMVFLQFQNRVWPPFMILRFSEKFCIPLTTTRYDKLIVYNEMSILSHSEFSSVWSMWYSMESLFASQPDYIHWVRLVIRASWSGDDSCCVLWTYMECTIVNGGDFLLFL